MSTYEFSLLIFLHFYMALVERIYYILLPLLSMSCSLVTFIYSEEKLHVCTINLLSLIAEVTFFTIIQQKNYFLKTLIEDN